MSLMKTILMQVHLQSECIEAHARQIAEKLKSPTSSESVQSVDVDVERFLAGR